MIESFLPSRAYLDSKLLFDSLGIFEMAGLVLLGLVAGLVIAHQIWYCSRKYLHQLEMETASLEGEALLIEGPPAEKPSVEVVEEVELVNTDVSNKSNASSGKTPKFVVEPEYRSNDSEHLFRTSNEVKDSGLPMESEEQRVVFIMDVSLSLKDPQLKLCKSELTKALKKLPPTTEYQVIFFSGATWFAHQRMVAGGKQGERVVIRDGDEEMIWKAGFGDFRFKEGNHSLPAGQWRKASGDNLAETLRDIRDITQSFGTTWHLPFMLAMNLDPVPSEIYFLTDGEVAHQDLVAEGIVEMVKSKGGTTRINTRSLMVPNATAPLRQIAKETSGEYLLIDLAKV